MELIICLFLYGPVLVTGVCVGSFLNVLIYRIPAGEDFTRGRSHCMSCGYTLSWYDLIPVLSWAVYRGKCRKCGAKISAQYPAIELLNGVLWTATFAVCGWSLMSCVYCCAISALIVIAMIDWRTYEIPMGLNLFLGACGLVAAVLDTVGYRVLMTGLTLQDAGITGGDGTVCHGWVTHLVGALVVSVPLLLIYLASGGRAMGGGDVKLMCSAGLLLGTGPVLTAFIAGCFLGVVIHILRMKFEGQGAVLAMGPYLAMGILIGMWFGTQITGWYLGLLGM